MIAVFSLEGHLFLPLSKLFPQPLSANLYCSVQLSNAYSRLLLLTVLLQGVNPWLRQDNHFYEIIEYLDALREPTWFFEELGDEVRRREHFEDIDYYVDSMTRQLLSLSE
jgi:hypothetical protein